MRSNQMAGRRLRCFIFQLELFASYVNSQLPLNEAAVPLLFFLYTEVRTKYLFILSNGIKRYMQSIKINIYVAIPTSRW